MNYFVYALEHIYTDETHTDCKFLGCFDNLEKLQEAKEKRCLYLDFQNTLMD